MVKLTADLVMLSAQFTNTLKDREIELRNNRIPAIENLGATLDQFDTIDLCNNDIRKVDGFPLLKRLKTVVLSGNRIVRIANDLVQSVPNLEELVLINNQLAELGDLDALATLPKLRRISLIGNPVAQNQHCRLYLIHKVPQLTCIDFRKVKDKERAAATTLFGGKAGEKLRAQVVKKSAAPPADEDAEMEPVDGSAAKGTLAPVPALPLAANGGQHTAAEVARIKAAIAAASSLEEMERLQMQLKSGVVPEQAAAAGDGAAATGMEVDEEDDDA